jgi:hypothetical protein
MSTLLGAAGVSQDDETLQQAVKKFASTEFVIGLDELVCTPKRSTPADREVNLLQFMIAAVGDNGVCKNKTKDLDKEIAWSEEQRAAAMKVVSNMKRKLFEKDVSMKSNELVAMCTAKKMELCGVVTKVLRESHNARFEKIVKATEALAKVEEPPARRVLDGTSARHTARLGVTGDVPQKRVPTDTRSGKSSEGSAGLWDARPTSQLEYLLRNDPWADKGSSGPDSQVPCEEFNSPAKSKVDAMEDSKGAKFSAAVRKDWAIRRFYISKYLVDSAISESKPQVFRTKAELLVVRETVPKGFDKAAILASFFIKLRPELIVAKRNGTWTKAQRNLEDLYNREDGMSRCPNEIDGLCALLDHFDLRTDAHQWWHLERDLTTHALPSEDEYKDVLEWTFADAGKLRIVVDILIALERRCSTARSSFKAPEKPPPPPSPVREEQRFKPPPREVPSRWALTRAAVAARVPSVTWKDALMVVLVLSVLRPYFSALGVFDPGGLKVLARDFLQFVVDFLSE